MSELDCSASNKGHQFGWNVLGIGFVLLLVIFGFTIKQLEPKSTAEKQYIPDQEVYKAISAMKDVVEVCIKEYKKSNQKRDCEKLNKILEVLQGSLDLAAQTSMAESTFGILHISYWQYWLSVITIVFLGMTVIFTYKMLDEAKNTTEHARKAAIAADRTANASENAEKAHVFVGVDFELVGNTGEEWRIIRPKVRLYNYGKSPAFHIRGSVFFDPRSETIDGNMDATVSSGRNVYTISHPIWTENEAPIDIPALPADQTKGIAIMPKGDANLRNVVDENASISAIIYTVVVSVVYQTIFQQKDLGGTHIEYVAECRYRLNGEGDTKLCTTSISESEISVSSFKHNIVGVDSITRKRHAHYN